MPNFEQSELIEGGVYLSAALRCRKHGKHHSDIMIWLGVYAALTSDVEAADNPKLGLDNEPPARYCISKLSKLLTAANHLLLRVTNVKGAS